MSWKEYFAYDFTKVLTPGSGSSFDTGSIRIDSDSVFEIIKTTFVSISGRIKLRIRNDGTGQNLNKGSVDIQSIAGRNLLPMGDSNSFMPYIWAMPMPISPSSTLTIDAADYSNASNTMRLVFHGNKIREGNAPWDKRWSRKIPFKYNFTSGVYSCAASASVSQTIELDNDSHFLIDKITGIRDGAALISINENARGRDWTNTSVHIDNIVGNGAFPNILTAPRFVPRGAVIIVNIQNLETFTNKIDIVLEGIKLYE